MQVVLRPALETFVREQVNSGAFRDATEVVVRALEVLKEQLEDAEDLRREAAIGIHQASRGEFADFTADDIKRGGRQILSKRNGRERKRAFKRN